MSQAPPRVDAAHPLLGPSSTSSPNLRATRPRLPGAASRPRLPGESSQQRLPVLDPTKGGGARETVKRKKTAKSVTIREPGGGGATAGSGTPPREGRGAISWHAEKHPAFAEGEWENELARSILVLYGSAMGSGEAVDGAETDFAIDRDAVRVPRDDVSAEEVRAAKARESREKRKARTGRAGARPTREATGVSTTKKAAPRVESKVQPIWFLGTGPLQAEWGSLPEGEALALELGALEEAGLFVAYVERVEASLNVYTQKLDERPGELFKRLWRQLAVTANVFGVRCVESRRFAAALEILKNILCLHCQSVRATIPTRGPLGHLLKIYCSFSNCLQLLIFQFAAFSV